MISVAFGSRTDLSFKAFSGKAPTNGLGVRSEAAKTWSTPTPGSGQGGTERTLSSHSPALAAEARRGGGDAVPVCAEGRKGAEPDGDGLAPRKMPAVRARPGFREARRPGSPTRQLS